ncbi:hypothetical protein [Streptomyces sp. NBC_00859]|uniref:hypothetical protein n=1 Tax=Streptomyces sp. NBC_00859 TaxID=2903682 RepID=UPI00386D9519|nr:hypothetical protein OG584_18450 [Streptomyces sp. NBC_00859]
MADQSRRTFLRQVSAGGAVAGAAALAPALLGGLDGHASARPVRGGAHRIAAPGVPYAVRVNMPAETVDQLSGAGYRLLMFKAVQSEESAGGLPVLWHSTGSYSTRTELAWTEQYYAYATTGDASAVVAPRDADFTRVSPGQTLDVGPAARGALVVGGTPGAITFSDTTATPFTCGLAQPAPGGGPVTPICALPLAGQGQDVVYPLGQVVLAFATDAPAVGSVVRSAPGPAIQVDLNLTNPADLSYDVDSGWSWDGAFAAVVPGGGFVGALVRPAPGGRLGGGAGVGTQVSGITVRTAPEPGSGPGTQAGAAAGPAADSVASGPPAAAATSGTETRTTITCTLAPEGHVVLHGRYVIEYQRPGRSHGRTGGRRQLVECTSVPAERGGVYTFKKLADDGR